MRLEKSGKKKAAEFTMRTSTKIAEALKLPEYLVYRILCIHEN